MKRMRFAMVLFTALLATAVVSRTPAESPAGAKDGPVAKAVAALYEGLRQETLPNGLRVVLKPIPGAPTVTVMTVYFVGSADEELDHTGLSHYLEHLMFKGTDKLMPGDIDKITRNAGGQNNAYTTEDYTNFHFDFASNRWQVALEIEADRMRNLRIDEKHEFEQEKEAVTNELIGDEDQPYDVPNKTLLPLLFGPKSPYGHPIIGERKHVENSTAQIIKSHYDKWYHPNNACLVIVGGFDADQALAKIKVLFGPIPRVELPPRRTATPIERTGPIEKLIPGKTADRCVMGFTTCKVGDPDDYVLDVIESVLSAGKTGRLYRDLVLDQEVAGEATCSNKTGKRPGWFSLQMEVMKDTKREKAERKLLEELKRLVDEPLSKSELRRAVRTIVAGKIFQREATHDLADNIVTAVALSDLEYMKSYLMRIEAVTAEDVQRAAKKYFDPEKRVVVWSLANPDEAAAKNRAAKEPDDQREPAGQSKPPQSSDKDPARAGTTTATTDLTLTTRKVLDNGLTLLLLENHRLPIVAARAFVKHVPLYESADKAGLAMLVGSLLEEGTEKHNDKQIAQMIEDVGGVLSLGSTGGSIKVLSPDRSLGLGVLLECLTKPAFDGDAVKQIKRHLLSEIDDRRQMPQERAEDEFERIIYGDHPLGRSPYGTDATVDKLTAADCRDFHDRVFVPNNTVLAVVGDFDTKTVIDEIAALTKDWKKRDLPKLDLPKIKPLAKSVEKIIPLEKAAQLNVYLGHLGVTRDNPDYYKLLVMDNILGIGTGFTDRLSSRLRDREGLAYTVTASITSTASDEPGLFTAFIGCEAKRFNRVKKEMIEEFDKMRAQKPSSNEVEEAKSYLIGAMPFKLATNEDLADQLLVVERFHLGLDYQKKFREAISAVTPEDVNAVAKKYLHPDRIAIVAVGPPIPPDDKSDADKPPR